MNVFYAFFIFKILENSFLFRVSCNNVYKEVIGSFFKKYETFKTNDFLKTTSNNQILCDKIKMCLLCLMLDLVMFAGYPVIWNVRALQNCQGKY